MSSKEKFMSLLGNLDNLYENFYAIFPFEENLLSIAFVTFPAMVNTFSSCSFPSTPDLQGVPSKSYIFIFLSLRLLNIKEIQ